MSQYFMLYLLSGSAEVIAQTLQLDSVTGLSSGQQCTCLIHVDRECSNEDQTCFCQDGTCLNEAIHMLWCTSVYHYGHQYCRIKGPQHPFERSTLTCLVHDVMT